jgi:uncharacterized UPF0160 family protein
MNKAMRNKFKRLQDWTASLNHVVENILPQMEETLDEKHKLPKNCPSKEAMAALEFRQIEKKLTEVVAAVKDIKQALLVRPELN